MKKSELKSIIKEVLKEGKGYPDEIERFKEIMDEIKDLTGEALDIVKKIEGGSTLARAKSYWFPHIMGAIDKENSGYIGGSMTDMAETLQELKEGDEGDDWEEDEGDDWDAKYGPEKD